MRSNGLGTPGIVESNTEKGCHRQDQCNPNPCRNEGICTDLWRTYQCLCYRPFLGPACQYDYTGATFGYENTTNSQVVVEVRTNSSGIFLRYNIKMLTLKDKFLDGYNPKCW